MTVTKIQNFIGSPGTKKECSGVNDVCCGGAVAAVRTQNAAMKELAIEKEHSKTCAELWH